MSKSIVLSFILLFLFNCNKNNDDQPKSGHIMIRIENSSVFSYNNILVKAFGNDYDFGDLNANELSDYQTFDNAYRYAYTQLDIENEQFIIQPIDFVGETELENGNYTYIISADTTAELYGRLNMILRED